jgi:hypothetical protein
LVLPTAEDLRLGGIGQCLCGHFRSGMDGGTVNLREHSRTHFLSSESDRQRSSGLCLLGRQFLAERRQVFASSTTIDLPAPPDSTFSARSGVERAFAHLASRRDSKLCGVRWRFRCGVWWRSGLGNSGAGRAKNNTTFAKRDVSLGVDRDGQIERLDELRAECPQAGVPSAELRV